MPAFQWLFLIVDNRVLRVLTCIRARSGCDFRDFWSRPGCRKRARNREHCEHSAPRSG